MTPKLLAPLALLPLIAACADDPEPWLARGAVAADVEPGGETLVRTHYLLTEDCEPLPPPQIAILEPGLLGEIVVRPTSVTVASPVDEEGEVTVELPCDGVSVPATAVYYRAGSTPGDDAPVYREIAAGTIPSRDWRTNIRIR